MHYIVGSVFRVGSPKPKTLRPVTAQQPTRKSVGPFTSDQVYTIYNIQPEPNKVKYTFVDSNMTPIVQVFESFKEADNFIAKVAGDQLPDYDEFYRKSNA